MWLAYVLSDTTAIFAAGLVAKGKAKSLGPFAKPDLVAFWAPFILVHLGGPDTITSFSLENNDLWLRHLLGLVLQCYAVLFVFFQSLPNNKLWIPTVLIFIPGLIKYGERTYAHYLASSRKLRETLLTDSDPGPNYAKFMDEYSSSQIEVNLPTRVIISEDERDRDRGELTDLQVLRQAYGFFQTFKGLIADQIFSFSERSESREFFLNRTPGDAFKLVEVELNFFYEKLYTKIAVVQGISSFFLRLLTFGLYWAAFALVFLVSKHNQGYKTIDIGITYTLLLGAISLDIIAFIMILNSDSIAVALTNNSIPKVLQKLVNVRRKKWHGNTVITRIVRRRWSESLSQFNVIDYCCHSRSNRWEHLNSNDVKYVSQVKFTNDLRDFIFEELKIKSLKANALESAKVIHSARGDWVLRTERCNNLLHWINEFDFNESLLLWHIATELCFNTEKVSTGTSTEGNNSENKEYCRAIAKHLSDYMLYLLIVESTMMSTVAGIGQIRFGDTCDEAKELFRTRNLGRAEASGVSRNFIQEHI